MKDFISHALNVATTKGARYADVRIINHREQVVTVKNGNVDGIGDQYSQGLGIRVLVGNSWGFAASAYVARAEIERVATLAVQIARASATVAGEAVNLGSPVTSRGQYTTPLAVDPFSVSLEQKLDLLFRADEIVRGNPGVKVSEANAIAIRNHKFFGNTEGALVEQIIYESGGAIRQRPSTKRKCKFVLIRIPSATRVLAVGSTSPMRILSGMLNAWPLRP